MTEGSPDRIAERLEAEADTCEADDCAIEGYGPECDRCRLDHAAAACIRTLQEALAAVLAPNGLTHTGCPHGCKHVLTDVTMKAQAVLHSVAK